MSDPTNGVVFIATGDDAADLDEAASLKRRPGSGRSLWNGIRGRS